MQMNQTGSVIPHALGEADGVINFAAQVVAMLAARGGKADSEPRADLLDALIAAVVLGEQPKLDEVLRELKRQRITVEVLADIYIPAAARKMGDAWTSDELSFADVTMAAARLQVILREIGAAWVADGGAIADGGSVLMIVPDREQHTLGAMVALGQLRRMGISVCLRFWPDRQELRNLLTMRHFDGMFVSIANREKLEVSSVLVHAVREFGPAGLPIIVGGAIMEHGGDVVTQTGADAATDDIHVALQACGLVYEGKKASRLRA